MRTKFVPWFVVGVGLAALWVIVDRMAMAQPKSPNATMQEAPPYNPVPSNPNRPVGGRRMLAGDEDDLPMGRGRGSPMVSGYREVVEEIVDERGQKHTIRRMVPVSGAINEFTPKKNELNQSLRQGVAAYQAASNEETKRTIEAKMEAQLGELFDVQQQEREAQLKPMEERVRKLRDTLNKRGHMRNDLVQLRLKVLLQDADGMGWGPDEFLQPLRNPGVGQAPFNAPNTTFENLDRQDPFVPRPKREPVEDDGPAFRGDETPRGDAAVSPQKKLPIPVPLEGENRT